MSSSVLVIPATAQNVRVARLVAAAAAQRAGMTVEDVDDVRLAVGEAVARAVIRSRAVSGAAVTIRLSEDSGRFGVEVQDPAPAQDDAPDQAEGFAIAVIAGLAPDMQVESTADGGSSLRISWTV